MSFRTASGQSYTLSSSISSTQTTITISSFLVPVSGTEITMATMGTTIAYGTIAPGTSSSELISFTGITQNADGTATLTGVTRGLNKEYPYTENSSFKQPHAGQTIFILSDAPQVFNEMAALKNDNTWTGRQQFPTGGSASAAVVGATYVAPTQDNEIATKKYIDDIAISGSPDATTSIKGIVELPTLAEEEAGTDTGGTGATLVLTNAYYGARKILGYALSQGSANAYTVAVTRAPSAYATGQIVGFTASFANTGNATVNISGLGAKNLFLGSTGLFAGAIATNAYVGAVYDGTRFEIVETSDLISASASGNTVPLRRTTGDITVPTTPTATTDAASKVYVDNITPKVYNGAFTISSSTTTTIVVGFTVKSVTIFANNGNTNYGVTFSAGGYTAAGNFCASAKFASGGAIFSTSTSSANCIDIAYGTGSSTVTALINNVTATGFDLVSTVAGSGTASVFYNATGY